jgi:hypothetical protein
MPTSEGDNINIVNIKKANDINDEEKQKRFGEMTHEAVKKLV